MRMELTDMGIVLPERIKAAVFDLDGTLIASSHVWSDIDEKFLAKRGIEVPEDYCRSIAVMNFREGADYTIARFGLDERPEDIVEEWFGMARYEYAHNIRIKDGAEDFLRLLKDRGVRTALATASSPLLYIPVLENNGVLDCFNCFASTEEVCRSKEHPDVYIYAAGKLGAAVKECAVFEDIPEGAESAASCGFYVCGCLDGEDKQAHERIRAAADVTFRSYSEWEFER